MSKWMSAAVVVVLAGCGMEPVEPYSVKTTAQPAVQVVKLPTALQPGSHLKAEPVAFAQLAPRDRVDVTFKLTEATSLNGKLLRIAVGQLGCGFNLISAGTATVANGTAQVKLTNLPSNVEELNLFIFSDADNDGLCTAADSVLEATFATTRFTSEVTLDLTRLEVGAQWLCFAFDRS